MSGAIQTAVCATSSTIISSLGTTMSVCRYRREKGVREHYTEIDANEISDRSRPRQQKMQRHSLVHRESQQTSPSHSL